ncbi:MAG: hypothetical protein QG628_837 [Patescibacteria group bacterium]|nr:hypothetical protein [Patescibacteria group bacterium]
MYYLAKLTGYRCNNRKENNHRYYATYPGGNKRLLRQPAVTLLDFVIDPRTRSKCK